LSGDVNMTIKVGVNGFGRIGRLAVRAAWEWDDIEFVQINDPGADNNTMAHLLNFDSTHGHWSHEALPTDTGISIGAKQIQCTHNKTIAGTDWTPCDAVIEASGVMKSTQRLQAYLNQGVKRVVVTVPVNEEGVLNIVMGVNHQNYDKKQHRIVTAASCTTNSLAPIVKVIHENLGIVHGTMTTIHALTNTQSILDQPRSDLRCARACINSLIPTTTGAATAITHIFPELNGKLNGHAVRVPIASPSLTDCVFEVSKPTSAEAVNALMKVAAAGELKDILGYEERPLVSIDYVSDPRSCIVDAPYTMVIDHTQVKLYAWYDNEWGYANRTVELVRLIGSMDKA
jgi:glyceraldehyde 3-phosphate dehydrogenase